MGVQASVELVARAGRMPRPRHARPRTTCGRLCPPCGPTACLAHPSRTAPAPHGVRPEQLAGRSDRDGGPNAPHPATPSSCSRACTTSPRRASSPRGDAAAPHARCTRTRARPCHCPCLLLLREAPPARTLPSSRSVNIIGEGQATLRSWKGCEATLDIRATCKIVGVAVEAELGSCIVHRAGARACQAATAALAALLHTSPCCLPTSGILTLERCRLRCDARGLDHLCSPLVTTATCAALPAPRPCLAPHTGLTPPTRPGPAGAAAGRGKLVIVECE